MTKRKRAPKRAPVQQKSAISPLVIGAVAAAAVLLVVGLIWLGNQGSQASAPVDVSDFPALGDPEASVTLTEYSDYG